jgi:hypothetical protein
MIAVDRLLGSASGAATMILSVGACAATYTVVCLVTGATRVIDGRAA